MRTWLSACSSAESPYNSEANHSLSFSSLFSVIDGTVLTESQLIGLELGFGLGLELYG